MPGDATTWTPDNPMGYRQEKPSQNYPIIIGDPNQTGEHLSR